MRGMLWVRFAQAGESGFGTLEGESIVAFAGDMFDGSARPTGETFLAAEVRLLTPCIPTKMIALWNNFGALAAKLGLARPTHPLYFFKAPSSFLATGEPVHAPASYAGRVAFEGELGIVIGKRCSNADAGEAAAAIFGYTCVNDVTAIDLLDADPSFAQWSRAKSFDGFGVFGPAIATGVEVESLVIRTLLDGTERQCMPVSDMTIQPVDLVRYISADMTLVPGDIIACGTSVGVGKIKPGNTVEVCAEGIGNLRNTFFAADARATRDLARTSPLSLS
jgi:2-keto-4-pentenoate hydratase/2-oxohepta-3-ene-1,7-dioic acid hydratase in catechol pathway